MWNSARSEASQRVTGIRNSSGLWANHGHCLGAVKKLGHSASLFMSLFINVMAIWNFTQLLSITIKEGVTGNMVL